MLHFHIVIGSSQCSPRSQVQGTTIILSVQNGELLFVRPTSYCTDFAITKLEISIEFFHFPEIKQGIIR